MLKNKFLLAVLFLLAVVTFISIPLFNGKKQPRPMKNALLFTLGNKNSYVLDVTTGEISLTASGLAAIAWSPSGERILYRNVFAEEWAGGLWVSESNGSNLQQVFSMADYPNMKIYRALWFTDNMLFISITDSHNGFFYSLDLNTMGLTEMNQNTVPDFISLQQKLWIQSRIENGKRIVEVASFSGVQDSTTKIDYNFYQGLPLASYSPDGTKFVYPASASLTGNVGDLWIINVNKKGFSNPRFFANVGKGEFHWSPDGKVLGILVDKMFKILDGETGTLLKEYPVNSRTTQFWWSPDSKSILTDDITNIWELNLATGDTKSMLNSQKVNTEIPILVVDWRLVPIP